MSVNLQETVTANETNLCCVCSVNDWLVSRYNAATESCYKIN